MKDLLKTYAPVFFLVAGVGIYWVYGQVSNLRAINQQLTIQLAQGCTTTLEGQGFVVTRAIEEEAELDKEDGEEAN